MFGRNGGRAELDARGGLVRDSGFALVLRSAGTPSKGFCGRLRLRLALITPFYFAGRMASWTDGALDDWGWEANVVLQIHHRFAPRLSTSLRSPPALAFLRGLKPVLVIYTSSLPSPGIAHAWLVKGQLRAHASRLIVRFPPLGGLSTPSAASPSLLRPQQRANVLEIVAFSRVCLLALDEPPVSAPTPFVLRFILSILHPRTSTLGIPRSLASYRYLDKQRLASPDLDLTGTVRIGDMRWARGARRMRCAGGRGGWAWRARRYADGVYLRDTAMAMARIGLPRTATCKHPPLPLLDVDVPVFAFLARATTTRPPGSISPACAILPVWGEAVCGARCAGEAEGVAGGRGAMCEVVLPLLVLDVPIPSSRSVTACLFLPSPPPTHAPLLRLPFLLKEIFATAVAAHGSICHRLRAPSSWVDLGDDDASRRPTFAAFVANTSLPVFASLASTRPSARTSTHLHAYQRMAAEGDLRHRLHLHLRAPPNSATTCACTAQHPTHRAECGAAPRGDGVGERGVAARRGHKLGVLEPPPQLSQWAQGVPRRLAGLLLRGDTVHGWIGGARHYRLALVPLTCAASTSAVNHPFDVSPQPLLCLRARSLGFYVWPWAKRCICIVFVGLLDSAAPLPSTRRH
ncbi:hypothetical protein C8R45DRAFT_1164307 [Mycena sanguinolenta]|nr:hypothetical protein C8R45DRAFT_1164307 [Mycena sanguinolenta]